MNILICSVGRRVKLVEYFRAELQKMNGKLIAVDCDPTAAALYHANIFEIVPRIDDPTYIYHIKKLCKKYNVKAVLSLIDPELTILASVKDEFENDDIQIIVSEREVIDICFNKYLTYQFLHEIGIPTVPTYCDMDQVIKDLEYGIIDFPLIVKPRNGSASLGIQKVFTVKELKALNKSYYDFIVQPFIVGEEYGVDCYIDMLSKETTNIFIKKKLKMRAGETDKSISIIDLELKLLIEKLVHVIKPIGPIDIDCFKTNDGYLISEINPRFGGGYPHAHEMGQNFVCNIINNLKGIHNEKYSSDYETGKTMVKFDDLLIF
jgi:carbamoyl-phosphate synthase large subunit